MDIDMRLIEALGGHHGHHLQNPVPTQTESNKFSQSELASAVSELTSLLRSNFQAPQGSDDPLYPNGHLSRDHANGSLTSQPAATLQLGLTDHTLLQSLRLGEESLQGILGCSLSSAVSTQEELLNRDGAQSDPHPQGSESSGIGRNSHDEELAEMQRTIEELSQPATRANSPPSIRGPGSFSECSGTPPTACPDGPTREDSQSMSPAPYRNDSQAMEVSPSMDVRSPQSLVQDSTGRARNSVGSSSKARQDDPYEDPEKAAERERVRGENRVRKKRWRESNQDRNKDNDLRCRVTKRGNKIWGLEDSEAKRLWMKHEFTRRRAKREAKERARAADETGLAMGAGSSSVFQAYNSSPPPPMSAANTSPTFSNFQTPFSDNRENATREALKNLVSVLHSPRTPQSLEGIQTASRRFGHGQPGGDLRGQRLESRQPTEIQNITPDTGSDRNSGNASSLEEVAWPPLEEPPFTYYNSSQIKDVMAALRMRFNAPTGVAAGGESLKPLESPMSRWPGPGRDGNGFFETVEVKTEPPEAPLGAQQFPEQPQKTGNAALVTFQQGIESARVSLTDSDIDALFPTNADGEPDLNDEALERLVAESGLCMDELLSGAMGPEVPTIPEPSRPSVVQREHEDIGDLEGGNSEKSMSLDQINALLGDLTEGMDLGEPIDTSSPHSTNLVSHGQAVEPTQNTIATLTNNWRSCQYPSTPSANTISRGTKRCSPDDSSSLPKRICKPPQNPIVLTQQLQVILQSSDHSQSISRHQVNPSYAASFGNSENMNKRLMKPPPYRPTSRPYISITTGPGSAAASHSKSNEHEKKIKSMGFPPPMAGMKPK